MGDDVTYGSWTNQSSLARVLQLFFRWVSWGAGIISGTKTPTIFIPWQIGKIGQFMVTLGSRGFSLSESLEPESRGTGGAPALREQLPRARNLWNPEPRVVYGEPNKIADVEPVFCRSANIFWMRTRLTSWRTTWSCIFFCANCYAYPDHSGSSLVPESATEDSFAVSANFCALDTSIMITPWRFITENSRFLFQPRTQRRLRTIPLLSTRSPSGAARRRPFPLRRTSCMCKFIAFNSWLHTRRVKSMTIDHRKSNRANRCQSIRLVNWYRLASANRWPIDNHTKTLLSSIIDEVIWGKPITNRSYVARNSVIDWSSISNINRLIDIDCYRLLLIIDFIDLPRQTSHEDSSPCGATPIIVHCCFIYYCTRAEHNVCDHAFSWKVTAFRSRFLNRDLEVEVIEVITTLHTAKQAPQALQACGRQAGPASMWGTPHDRSLASMSRV